MDGSLFMRTLAVIAFLALAFPGRAEMDALSVSCSAAPSLPSPVLVVYGSEEPGSAEARWLKALQPGTEERRALDEYVRDVQFVTVPRHPSVKDWEENGSLSRAAMHGVRMLPSVVFLDSKGRVFDLVERGASAASLREKVSLLAEKAQRVRPVTRVNDIPKGGDPAAEASAIMSGMDESVITVRRLAPGRGKIKPICPVLPVERGITEENASLDSVTEAGGPSCPFPATQERHINHTAQPPDGLFSALP